jgi:hypothetical protein
LNINSDLSFQDNNGISLRSIRFQSQPAPLAIASDLGCLYESGVDLYYNDGNGNQIRLTQSGSIVGTAGSITGLPSGTAGASYAAGTFTFQSATLTSANLDFGSAILRNNSISSHGLTLSPPAAMGADFNLVLPSIPANTSFVTLDTSGNLSGGINTSLGITTSNIASQAITAAKIANQTITGSQVSQTAPIFSGTVTYTNAGDTAIHDVTGLNGAITTTGHAVLVALTPTYNSASLNSYVSYYNPVSTEHLGVIYLAQTTQGVESRTNFGSYNSASFGTTVFYPPSTFWWIDIGPIGAPGTYDYKVQVQNATNGDVMILDNVRLMLYELPF